MALYAQQASGYPQSLPCSPGRPIGLLLPLLLLLLLLLHPAAALFQTLFSLPPLGAPPFTATATVAGGDDQAAPAAAWISGHASFYGEHNAAGTMGGACGYGNTYSIGYGVATTALSTTLFKQGLSCGACFEVKCSSLPRIDIGSALSMYQHDHCLGGEPSIVVTATNLCPPNTNMPQKGSWCNPPLHHFDLPKPLFHTIAHYQANIVPILYRRVMCERKGGIHFTINGSPSLGLVLVSNVGGAGDVHFVSIKTSSNAKWIKLKRSWGQNWQYDGSLSGQSLSFKVQTSDEKVLISYEVVPKDWEFGQTFEGAQYH